MPASVNQQLADATVDHSVDLQHYANGVVYRMIALLNRTDVDLAAQLSAAIERLGQESFTVERLDQLLASVRELNTQAYDRIESELGPELQQLTSYEAGYQLQLFTSVLPAQVPVAAAVSAETVAGAALQAVSGIGSTLETALATVEQVYAAAMARPFQGKLLSEWIDNLEEQRAIRVRDAIRIGFVENATNDEIIKKIRGTRANGYEDGIIQIDRRNAEAVVRTAVQHTAGFVRDRFHEANSDILESVQWSSTLDTRTSEICRVRDGLEYEAVSHKPVGHHVPWLGGPGRAHWQCRSCSVPVVKGWGDLGSDVDVAGFDGGTRASMDGQVAEETTYAQWLEKQSAARQDQVLGASRGKLLREGGLSVEKFSNNRGRWLSLDELRASDAAAFRKAGLE